MGVGIDKAPEKNEIELTTQIVKADKLHPAEGQSAGDQKAYFNLVGTGTDVFTILRSDTHKVSASCIFHITVIILGEDLAKEGVQDYLDFFMRESRSTAECKHLVSQGKANNVLDFEPIWKNPGFQYYPASGKQGAVLKPQISNWLTL
jgi:spore germination protein KC